VVPGLFILKIIALGLLKNVLRERIRKEAVAWQKVKKINERAENRIIGITIETRPDYVNKAEVKDLRRLGVTRVELGVQSIYDDILALNKRGNSVSDIIQATKLLKNAGFKITYH